jgi:hypothetical protein
MLPHRLRFSITRAASSLALDAHIGIDPFEGLDK